MYIITGVPLTHNCASLTHLKLILTHFKFSNDALQFRYRASGDALQIRLVLQRRTSISFCASDDALQIRLASQALVFSARSEHDAKTLSPCTAS